MAFYILKSTSNAEEYALLSGDFSDLKKPCMKSEYQFLNKKPVTFNISDAGGLELPDVIMQEGIWLISDKVKNTFDEFGVDYVFYKKANIVDKKFGVSEIYWIMVPPRIDCLDIDESNIDTSWDFRDGVVPNLNFSRIVISSRMLGRYDIFKIIGINDYNIYVTQKMYKVLSSKKFSGITLMKL